MQQRRRAVRLALEEAGGEPALGGGRDQDRGARDAAPGPSGRSTSRESPICAPVQSSTAPTTRSGDVEQELQADRTADRVTGVGEAAAEVVALGEQRVDDLEDAGGQLGHRERLLGHGAVVAVTRQVPRDHVEGVGEAGGAGGPERGGRGADRRTEHQQRQLGPVAGAGQADGGDARLVIGAPLRVRRRLGPAAPRGRRPWRRGSHRPRRSRPASAMLRCSARTSSRAAARRVAIRSACTLSPASSSLVWDAATTRPAEQRPQRRPLGVPGTVGALVERLGGGQVQRGRELRRRQRGAAYLHGEHRVRLVRHRRGPAAGALGQLADLGAAQGQHVVGEAAPGVGAPDGGVAEAGDRGAGGVPRGRRGEPEPGGEVDGEVGDDRDRVGRGRRPARRRRPWCRPLPRPGPGRPGPFRSSYASRTPVSHWAAFSPNVVGTACWVSVRAAIGVCRCTSTRSARARICAAQLGADGTDRVPRPDHQRGVDHVLAGQPAVQPAGGVRRAAEQLAQEGDQRDHRVAGAPRRDSAMSAASSSDTRPARSASSSPAEAGATPAATSASSHAVSTATIARRYVGVGEVLAGAFVARPEEVRHGISLRAAGR